MPKNKPVSKITEKIEISSEEETTEQESVEEIDDGDPTSHPLLECEIFIFEELVTTEEGKEVWVPSVTAEGDLEGVFLDEEDAQETLDELIEEGEDPNIIRFRKYQPAFELKR